MHYFILVICMWASLSTILATPAICLPCIITFITIIIIVTTTIHSNIFLFHSNIFLAKSNISGSPKYFLVHSKISFQFTQIVFQSDLLRGVHVALAVPQVAPPVPAPIGVPLPEVVVDLAQITHYHVTCHRVTCHVNTWGNRRTMLLSSARGRKPALCMSPPPSQSRP